MEKYIILPDVTCDLSDKIREHFGIEDYIPSHVNINGKELPTTLDWSMVSREEFYKTLSNKKSQVSTAPASPEEFYEKFKGYAQSGFKVLFISISSKISSTFEVASRAAERVMSEIADSRVVCFDSTKMTGALGLLVINTFIMQKDGKSFDEVVAWLDENKHRVHQMGPIDDLIFVARRGRISMGKAVMGSFVGVKPMGDCNRDGYTSVLTKAKGMKKALEMTARYVEKMAVNTEDQYLIISHSDREEYANELKALIGARIMCRGIFVSDIFCACGTNIGPGMVGVYFMGDEITEDLEKEKNTLEEIAAAIG
jgi:DegV family protein with EDD domain